MGSWIFRIITGHSEYSRISPGTSFVQWEMFYFLIGEFLSVGSESEIYFFDGNSF